MPIGPRIAGCMSDCETRIVQAKFVAAEAHAEGRMTDEDCDKLCSKLSEALHAARALALEVHRLREIKALSRPAKLSDRYMALERDQHAQELSLLYPHEAVPLGS